MARIVQVSIEETPEDLRIARVNDLTRAGRANWFGLLAYLAFAMVTLLAVEDVDFFVESRQTQLPLIGVSIPTGAFFYAAPILGAALHVYLHLFVRKATAALMAAPPELNGERLETHVLPWLLNDLVLRWRGVAQPRPLDGLATITAILLVWVAGPFVLGYAWWRSWPAHDPWMSFTALGCMLIALYASLASWTQLLRDLKMRLQHTCGFSAALIMLGMLFFATFLTLNRSAFGRLEYDAAWFSRLSSADLSEQVLTPLPADWLPYETHKRRFRIEWCAREGLDPETCGPPPWSDIEPVAHLDRLRSRWCLAPGRGLIGTEDCSGFFTALDNRFLEAWKTERETRRSTLTRWAPPRKDLRKANLRDATLTAADLRQAEMEGANLSGAQMEGADLRYAQLQGADLSGAEMEGADLSWVEMEGADLSLAEMEGANLSGAQMEGAILLAAQMQGADLRDAEMEGADLLWAEMEGADLGLAEMEGANLSGAEMEGANLRYAQLQGADLGLAEMEGADLSGAQMEGADLSGAQMEGADLREAQLKSADWAGVRIETVPALSADFRGGTGLTQSRLSPLIGNAATLLPDDPDLYVCTCWDTEPPHWSALVNAATDVFTSEDDLREDFLCPAGETPQKTGTPWPVDRATPWEEAGLERDDWMAQQQTRGPCPAPDP